MAKTAFKKPGEASAPPATKTQPKLPPGAQAPTKTAPPQKAAAATPPKAAPAKVTPPKPAAKPSPAAPPPRQSARKPPAEKPTASEAQEDQPHVEEQSDLAPAVISNLMTQPIGTGSGEMTPGDYEIPKLKLSQAVGPLADAGFESGQWVLNDIVVLWADGCADVEITILKYQKQFVEELPWGSDEFPRIFNTSAEAEAAGLSTEWGPNGEKPEAMPQLLCMVVVKRPEGVEPDEFSVEHGEDLYAVALWRISGVAYKCVKTITGAQRTRLAAGLHTGSFLLSAKKVTGKNTYYVPILEPGSKHDDEFVEFLVEKAKG